MAAFCPILLPRKATTEPPGYFAGIPYLQRLLGESASSPTGTTSYMGEGLDPDEALLEGWWFPEGLLPT